MDSNTPLGNCRAHILDTDSSELGPKRHTTVYIPTSGVHLFPPAAVRSRTREQVTTNTYLT